MESENFTLKINKIYLFVTNFNQNFKTLFDKMRLKERDARYNNNISVIVYEEFIVLTYLPVDKLICDFDNISVLWHDLTLRKFAI